MLPQGASVPTEPTPTSRSAAVPLAPNARRGWVIERAPNVLLPTVAIVVVFLVWAAIVKLFAIPDYLLPAPQDVATRMVKEAPTLWRHGLYTLASVLTGFAAGVLIGVPLAFGIVLSRAMERVTMPFLVMSQTIPKVAIAPILVVWLGFGILPKIA